VSKSGEFIEIEKQQKVDPQTLEEFQERDARCGLGFLPIYPRGLLNLYVN
jgi:hypothetical protein